MCGYLGKTSGSAIFTYAFITGVKHGWLDAKEYAPATRKAWMALLSYINENGGVMEVCVGTNKKNDKQYYYDRPRNVGDYQGQAPYLWCTFALLEKVINSINMNSDRDLISILSEICNQTFS